MIMFRIKAESDGARTGVIKTAHGNIETPNFKAVATKGAVKMITTDELKEMGAQEVISNAFILYLRPGLEIIEAHGGLHKFMDWDRAIFTDCGGFQVLSMEKEFHVKTTMRGIEFKSPFDGTNHILNPEKLMEIQNRLGSDVAMALDDMPLYGCTRDRAIESMKNTNRWMEECIRLHNNRKQLLFGIAQGSFFPDLRKKAVKAIDSLDFDGIAFGGLAIGEPKDKMYDMIKISSANCSREKPRYVMGVGSPADIIRCIDLSIDTFDSVWPTRNARHGHIFTRDGPMNIENSRFRKDYSMFDEGCRCRVCRKHTKSYMSHLFKTREPLGLRLASYHNLFFMYEMLKNARKAIKNDEFSDFKREFLRRYEKKQKPKTGKAKK